MEGTCEYLVVRERPLSHSDVLSRGLSILFAFVISVRLLSPSFAQTGEPYLSPQVMTALDAAELGVATSEQRALLFSQNDKINRAALNGWVTDGRYQAAQRDFAALNRGFAENAAREESAGFTQQESQPGKKGTASPGTDSDYIIKVDSPEQVKRIQESYNRRINSFLAEHGVAAESGTWHKQLDTDFMADPNHVSQGDFEKIAKLNNDAYRRREAAQYEAIIRAEIPGKVSPEQFRAYGRRCATSWARSRPCWPSCAKSRI